VGLIRFGGHLILWGDEPCTHTGGPEPMGKPTHVPYDPEFRARAVELVRTSGLPRTRVARDLGINPETLRLWVKQAAIDAGQQDGLTTAEKAELARLRRENRLLREEREILKKAAAFFARERAR
jgi:transposase